MRREGQVRASRELGQGAMNCEDVHEVPFSVANATSCPPMRNKAESWCSVQAWGPETSLGFVWSTCRRSTNGLEVAHGLRS